MTVEIEQMIDAQHALQACYGYDNLQSASIALPTRLVILVTSKSTYN